MQLRHEMSRFGVVLFMVALGACQAVENHGPAEPALHAKRITADDLAGVAAGSAAGPWSPWAAADRSLHRTPARPAG